MKVGVRTGTLRQDWDAALRAAKELGFDGVELDVGAKYKDTLFWNPDARAQLVQVMNEVGISVPCVCIGGLWQLSPASPEATVREEAQEFIRGTVLNCAEVGAYTILAPINDARGQGYDVAKERWLEIMKQVAPVAEEKHVCVALENCGCSAQYQLELVEAVGSPYVRAYFDMANSKGVGEDPVEAIRLLGRHVAHVHAKDLAYDGDKRQNVPLGEGLVDIPGCIAALKKVGYDDYLTLETPAGDDAAASARQNLQFLRNLI